jgi:hypothetical protein
LIKYSDGQIKKNEMGGACGTYGGEQRYILVFGEKCERRSHLGDLDVDDRIILK